jgi:hypothetical protein
MVLSCTAVSYLLILDFHTICFVVIHVKTYWNTRVPFVLSNCETRWKTNYIFLLLVFEQCPNCVFFARSVQTKSVRGGGGLFVTLDCIIPIPEPAHGYQRAVIRAYTENWRCFSFHFGTSKCGRNPHFPRIWNNSVGNSKQYPWITWNINGNRIRGRVWKKTRHF